MRLFLFMTGFVPILFSSYVASALRYDPDEIEFNLNQNVTATDPLDYWGEWENHTYYPSPDNWRIPFYTLFIDRFVNGDPSNDDANNTMWEHDLLSTQLRHGGDVRGLMDSLDYLQGMGVQAIYIAGTPYINQPWASDAYSPLDLTLLDYHFGSIEEWRMMIDAAHRYGIYIIIENTMATLGDLIGFVGYLNATAPINPYEYDYIWKSSRRYHDFQPGNAWLEKCEYPRFWEDNGVGLAQTRLVEGCRESEFDQYGEVLSLGNYKEWERQIAKFGMVQDRLREWRPDVRRKIEHFSCMTIAMLDIDGFRIDKGVQVTIDAQGEWSDFIRKCARRFGKENFYIPGEIVSGNAFSALYMGRGRQTNQSISNMTMAMTMTNVSAPEQHIRAPENAALDAVAFHYSFYRALTRFLGLDGIYEAEGDPPTNFVQLWREIVATNDMVNPNTGQFDPRHLYGTSNQDVFRWPSIANGTEKEILALYLIYLVMPGAPLLTWGEEQAFYILENTNANYIFGRSPMSSAEAWQLHGCYKVGSDKYSNFPVGSASCGCMDDNVSFDHRDPTHPVRGFIKMMSEMRENYPVLNDGFYLEQLSNSTYDIYLPASAGIRTETGLWSVMRSGFDISQDFTGVVQENQTVWMVFQNENHTVNYSFNCSDHNKALISPFDEGTIAKNLFPPFEEYHLRKSSTRLGLEGSKNWNGCLRTLTLPPWGCKALVPKDRFIGPSPFITKFIPGHDKRILSTTDQGDRVPISFQFSEEMDCTTVTKSLSIQSTTSAYQNAQLDDRTIKCGRISNTAATWPGALLGVFSYSAELTNVFHGVHEIVINNPTNKDGNRTTNSVDHFMFRIGSLDNPMIWPKVANYSRTLLHRDSNGSLVISHKASGAEKWRYTLDFGSSFSKWMPYQGGKISIPPKAWVGAKWQAWEGEHVTVQYWNRITGSSNHYQHGDLDWGNNPPRRFPHFWVYGAFNEFGFDKGYQSNMHLTTDSGQWEYDFMTEYPVQIVLNVWGMNRDGQPDKTQVFGDIDGDNILDRISPDSLATNFVNVTAAPQAPHLAYRLFLNDGNLRISLTQIGSRTIQLAVFILLAVIPPVTAVIAVWTYLKAFYRIKLNKIGVNERNSFSPLRRFKRLLGIHNPDLGNAAKWKSIVPFKKSMDHPSAAAAIREALNSDIGDRRRTVLVATMEYNIPDWDIKIKIGGLGVMAQLVGENLEHLNLIWVVPCVGDVDYPQDQIADPMLVTILGRSHRVQIQYHRLRNITYVLLDAPIFRKQTKAEPYPARMDDLDSAIYYSTWNSCIAETLKRFPVDLYHINDYHGGIAPLHLLPETIPCCLTLHNAEFQGLWLMRTAKESQEVCEVFALDPAIVKKYVQFGDVFNLLHAAASYLNIHQNGFGAVGVSKKYGKRTYQRYPIFWGLKAIGSLPNPDPSDTGDWTGNEPITDAEIDQDFEARRPGLKQQAQEWASLNQDPNAELFVFVGRWSMQKGVDLIADVFPSVLESHPQVQLICVGPVIDLYGRFAAIKLNRIMELYPGRVFSKPEFTTLPPFVFTGAEFTLIPSRDEPFGLVAVEFGRKGVIAVGSRVGGLGQMPGWWYTIESNTSNHLIPQLKGAINDALNSKPGERAQMRARSGKQRFPVSQWVEKLEALQAKAIEKHRKHSKKGYQFPWKHPRSTSEPPPTASTPHSRPTRSIRRNSLQAGSLCSGHSITSASINSHSADCQREIPSPRSTGHFKLASEGESSDEEKVSRSTDQQPGLSLSRVHSIQRNQNPSCTNDPPEAQDPPSLGQRHEAFENQLDPSVAATSGLNTPTGSCGGDEPPLHPPLSNHNAPSDLSLVSVEDIVREKQNYNLQKVNPFFTDPHNQYSQKFERKLANLSGKNSETQLCVEEYLCKSEKEWFNRYRHVKLGKSPMSTPASSIFRVKIHNIHNNRHHNNNDHNQNGNDNHNGSDENNNGDHNGNSNNHPLPQLPSTNLPDDEEKSGEFALPSDYRPPPCLGRLLLRKLGDWPIYSLLLAFGQIIAANSYQITLLNGSIGQPAVRLYVIASIYLVSSIVWWIIFRSLKSVYALSLPFLFYGTAFLFVAVSPGAHNRYNRFWLQNVATALYAIGSSSGSLFFSLNFGDEGNAPLSSWAYRACVIQGTQQIYVAFLWYWGGHLASHVHAGAAKAGLADSNPGILIGVTVSCTVLLYTVAVVLFFGLPGYYRQAPGKVPAFYQTLFRRKIILWFFYTVFIQNYWLSAQYGRNWLYLWSSKYAKPWQIIILVIVFFIVLWALALWIFGALSKRHAWIIPIFAIGLGAPRWCQLLWSTSNYGTYIPWAGGEVAGALVGRGLWLWLGLLDAIQGVGFGLILLNTLTRFHVAFTLLAAQVIGSVGTILSRATAPDRVGPDGVFPNFAYGVRQGVSKADFWVCLLFMLSVNFLCFMFFRKEQLQKP